MIQRSIIATCVYFQVVTIIKWDISVYIQGHQVLSQCNREETNFNYEYEITTESNSESNQSVCAACEGTTESESVTYTSKACEVSEDDLQKLFDLILEAFNKINYGFRSSRCQKCNRKYVEEEDSCDGLVDNCRNSSASISLPIKYIPKKPREDCEDRLEEMQSKMHVIIEQLDLLLDAIIDPSRLLEKIAQLQNCVKCLEGTIDIVKQDAQKISQCYESSLGRVTTCFTTTINERTERIQELETRVTNKTINVIVSNVLASKYVEAAIEYRDLRNESLFDTMMNDMFESRQLENILHFSKALYHNNVTGRVNVYMKLMKLMNNSQPIDTNEIIFSSFVSRDRIEFCNGDPPCIKDGLPYQFVCLYDYSTPKVDKILDKWAILVRNNDFKTLLLLGSPEVVSFSGKAFHDIIENLVTKSYDKNSDYLGNTLNFATALRWNNQSYTAFKTLLTEATRPDDKLKISIKMKEKMASLTGPDGQETISWIQFDKLRKGLPDNVRGIAFDEICSIIRPNDLYLSTFNSFYEGGNRKIGFQYTISNESKWRFQKIERSLHKYEFRIINVDNGEYLGTHIPWKFKYIAFDFLDVCATSNPDYIEPPRKFYNWQIRYGGVNKESDTYFYHVGRRAYLIGREALLDMRGYTAMAEFSMSCQ